MDRGVFVLVKADGTAWLFEPTFQAVEEHYILLERVTLAQLRARRPQLMAELQRTGGVNAPRVVEERQ